MTQAVVRLKGKEELRNRHCSVRSATWLDCWRILSGMILPLAFSSVAYTARAEPLHNTAGGVESSTVQSFIMFATNPPRISNAVLEYYLNGSSSPVIFEFCYQSNAFFAREITSLQDLSTPVDNSKSAAGNWGDEYWSYTKDASGTPVFNTYTFREDDLAGTAYSKTQFLQHMFSFFTTFGLSGAGVHSVRFQDGLFHVKVETYDQRGEAQAKLVVSNGIPAEALKTLSLKTGRTMSYAIDYRYDLTVAPYPVPAEIRVNDVLAGGQRYPGLIIRVKTILVNGAPLEKGRFIPSELLANKSLTHIVWTNKANYLMENHRLRPMDKATAMQLFDPYGVKKKRLISGPQLAALLLVANAVFLWIMLRIRKQTVNRKNPQSTDNYETQ